MEKLIVLFTCITLAVQAADEFREFTANDGRTLNAKVLSYDSKMDTVEIQRDDLQVIRVKSAAFSEADQVYVKQWAPCSLFMSPEKFAIIPRRTVVKKGQSTERRSEVSTFGSVSEYQYEISICNRTGLPMENLTMNYLIYYAYDLPAAGENVYPQESHKWTDQNGLQEEWALVTAPNIKIVKGTIPVGGLEAGGWKNFTTDRVAVLEQHAEAGSAGSSSGILVTISMATPDGGRMERSISLPKNMEQDSLQDMTGASRTAVKRSIPRSWNS
ncbi:hypothetical protein [Pontiella sulfatireligans]|uniref:Uncharacterized protein n=1 Tax=Pontiella sulfatireligans TaxID=2750658 RepID=A0A6C2ULY3_9BACT|nr:hypothetical protein [Pontiella sulfatireligans]VGO20314.1 hypothetical protein SCARR_02376 [Pontiella sulfatireligans]